MFDISWTEFLLIGVVALIVIGPKELPGVLRTLGQYTRKVRSMAAEFQNQFQEAMREAEMVDLKKQVDDMAHDFKHFDPLKDVRADVESMGKDIERSMESPAEPKVAPEATEATAETPAEPQSLAPPAASEPGAAEEPAPAESSQSPAIEREAAAAPAAAPADNAGRAE
jgi:sec-independent protein translocase protein TatB